LSFGCQGLNDTIPSDPHPRPPFVVHPVASGGMELGSKNLCKPWEKHIGNLWRITMKNDKH